MKYFLCSLGILLIAFGLAKLVMALLQKRREERRK